jgi:hypothetical protein
VKPGEAHDRRGVPIYPGDLIRSFHFRERPGGKSRGRIHYLYHTAVLVGDRLEMVPTSHLEPSMVKGGGRCRLSQELVADAEVISGHGPGECLDYLDRPRATLPERSDRAQA